MKPSRSSSRMTNTMLMTFDENESPPSALLSTPDIPSTINTVSSAPVSEQNIQNALEGHENRCRTLPFTSDVLVLMVRLPQI